MDNRAKEFYEKIVKNEFPGFVRMLKGCMNFNHWGFEQTFYGLATEFAPSVIYNSESCRTRFIWLPADPRDGYPTLGVEYGRLHASDQQRFIVYKGELSHCWHDIRLLLKFLDGLSPQQAVESKFKMPDVMDQFVQSNKGNTWSQVEWEARKHAYVWEHYGNRLFDVFDLRRPDLWEQYRQFIKEYYRLDPGLLNPSVPWPEKIC